MGHEGLAVTAQCTAAGRAVESRRADRLFEDPLAAALAGEEGVGLMRHWQLLHQRRALAGADMLHDEAIAGLARDR